MTTRSTVGGPPAPADSFSIKTRRREFEKLLMTSAVGLIPAVFVSGLAMGNGVNPLALGWLLVIVLCPSIICFVAALPFSRVYVYQADASGVSLKSRGKTIVNIPWDRVRRVQHGPLHVRLLRSRLTGLLLVVAGKDGNGVFLSSLRHDVAPGTVLRATECTARLAEAHGVEVVACEILGRDRWEPLGRLGS